MSYPSDDKTDFINADYGYIASGPGVIYSSTAPDIVVWDNDAYNFITDECPEDMSQLCHKQGLFKVVEGICQVRGFDVSNITFVEMLKTNGVVVIDPLTSIECAQEALELYRHHRPGMEIKALIFSHSHVDHYGGAQAIIDQGGDGFQIYAPDGFFQDSVSENVYVGTAMARRALYQFGDALPKSPEWQIGCGIGMTVPTGATTLVAPTKNITTTGEYVCIDDLKIVFQMVPGTEAPAEMNIHFPAYKALCIPENATHTLQNLQTLRGALVRDARVWSRSLDETIILYGKDSDVVFASHHWPTFGNDKVIEFLTTQRDLYAYLHNETLRLLNSGFTGLEIAENFLLPPSLKNVWSAHGYYGSISHNVKAIYHRCMGWFDGNPAHLWEYPPVESACHYVDCMGGIDKVIDKALEYKEAKDLRFASTPLSHAVFANQDCKRAREELSAVFKKLAYGCENGIWRNFYLNGARELVGPINKPLNKSLTLDSLLALDIEQLLDMIALRIEGPKAWDASFIIDVMITDMKNGGWHINMGNGVMTHYSIMYKPGAPNPETSLTFWPTHQQFVVLAAVALGGAEGIRYSKGVEGIRHSGYVKVWETLTSFLVDVDIGFAIVTPDKPTNWV